jgi:hypothetical protein
LFSRQKYPGKEKLSKVSFNKKFINHLFLLLSLLLLLLRGTIRGHRRGHVQQPPPPPPEQNLEAEEAEKEDDTNPPKKITNWRQKHRERSGALDTRPERMCSLLNVFSTHTSEMNGAMNIECVLYKVGAMNIECVK